jgi:hypothetical protein
MQNRRVYRSALGREIDMDAMLAMNEREIAVGNMKVNARGDELGPGGIVLRTREEVMEEYYKVGKQQVIYTTEGNQVADQAHAQAVAEGENYSPPGMSVADLPNDILEQDAHMPEKPFNPLATDQGRAMRGSLADSVAKNATVEQKLLTPRNKSTQRI